MPSTHLLPTRLAASRLLGTGGVKSTGHHRDAGFHVILGKPGACPRRPTLVIPVFDNSGSVAGGNDPIGNRYLEAAYALDRVSRHCRCDQELAAIIHFDTPTSGDVPPTPINKKRKNAITRGLAIPPDGAGRSELRNSLHKAHRIAEAYPKYDTSLVVFSDFELFDTNLPSLYAELADFPGTVHAVVLRAAVPAEFAADTRIHVTQIGYEAQPGAVARAVFDALTTHRPGRHLAKEDQP